MPYIRLFLLSLVAPYLEADPVLGDGLGNILERGAQGGIHLGEEVGLEVHGNIGRLQANRRIIFNYNFLNKTFIEFDTQYIKIKLKPAYTKLPHMKFWFCEQSLKNGLAQSQSIWDFLSQNFLSCLDIIGGMGLAWKNRQQRFEMFFPWEVRNPTTQGWMDPVQW